MKNPLITCRVSLSSWCQNESPGIELSKHYGTWRDCRKTHDQYRFHIR